MERQRHNSADPDQAAPEGIRSSLVWPRVTLDHYGIDCNVKYYCQTAVCVVISEAFNN